MSLKNQLIFFLKALTAPKSHKHKIDAVCAKLQQPRIMIPEDPRGKQQIAGFLSLFFGKNPELKNEENKQLTQDFSNQLFPPEKKPSQKPPH